MKKTVLLFALSFLLPVASQGEEFLGAPVIPQGETLTKTNARLELKLQQSHEEVVAFYRQALEDFKDIKFREWSDATYIEDDGNLSWHSITISKGEKGEATTVVIVKDNWTWIIGTLVLRYVGVFVVLMVLFLGMSVSGALISRSVKKLEQKKAAG